MPSWIIQLGALMALAQTISGAEIYIKSTQPPANLYVTHCSVIIEDELFGCKGSSEPFKRSCGRNKGIETKSICKSATVTVDWTTAQLSFKNSDGNTANCTLNSTSSFGHCNTDNPDEYPIETVHKSAASGGLAASAALLGLGTMAAGLLI
ncbi:hypothetical protein BO94DRAFT_549652 [Aspergillus sclerotioniger CBS 115572]|uniref:Uncharacterized protein n=1 Tax=Aspergillus sclerotioniger CBS 115572 TaxID=1450535 RepID=A0A317VNU2_9EURO|nr:hypothetical protein BO94DRAFT_549652 [Aspergillus sclerotioniger CBS 115572]PWY74522.1 hypothetical protein BO94DRAFT_549652 [Aspergillus sclerotioniger CBS 115572]